MPKNIPTEMYISKNAIAENPEHLTAAKRAFIVTGKHGAKASGALSDVTAVLDGAGIPYSTELRKILRSGAHTAPETKPAPSARIP